MSKSSSPVQECVPEVEIITESSQKSADSVLSHLVQRVHHAQEFYSSFTQEEVDRIFRDVALAAVAARLPLAAAAAEETKMGITEDKVIKNHFAAEYIYNKFKHERTCGIIEEDTQYGVRKVAEPLGVIAGIIPVTNPTSTTIFKTLLALKTRNGIIFSPHPNAKKCTCKTAQLLHDAAVEAGAPVGIIGWIDEPSVALSRALMSHKDISLILATGGPGMVNAAYSSGKPAIGVGAGNTPAIIDETADIRLAVNSILLSKTYDNGMICASEQSVIVVRDVYNQVKDEFIRRGAYFVSPEEKEHLRHLIIQNGHLNPNIVGQSAIHIARMANIAVPIGTRVLIAETSVVGAEEPLSYEKLSPVLAMYKAEDFTQAVIRAESLIQFGGLGHTSVLYTNPMNSTRILEFGDTATTGRILINQPSSQGAIGDIYNFRLEPSLTLGCGSWGGNSVSENVGVKHLINIKTISERRENMLWFRVPQQIYFNSGCLPHALAQLEKQRRAFIVTDQPLYDLGIVNRITHQLDILRKEYQIFTEVKPDPDLITIQRGLKLMNEFKPDLIIAVGGGSPMDAAKLMWLLYEHPHIEFQDLALRFMDIMKRVFQFPRTGTRAKLVCIPTTSGTGSEVTPFAVVTDERTGRKYPITDYVLTPSMAIVDADLVMNLPQHLTAYSGVDALVHALEALVAVTATDYSNAMALESARIIFKYLPICYDEGNINQHAREKIHNAATMAGMAFGNAFLGICHSMAHKIGATFSLPHGLANALLIEHVMRYNATNLPSKQAVFPQYGFPDTASRYARMARYVGLGSSDDEDADLVLKLVKHVRTLCDTVHIPRTIRESGVPEEAFLKRLDEMALDAWDDQCTGTNPRYPLVEEIRGLYLDAYYGVVREK